MNIQETGFILFLEHYDENVKFYTEKIGLKVREVKEGLSKLEFGGSYLMVEDGGVSSDSAKSRFQNPTVIRLDVLDFEETVRELESRTVSVEVRTFDWGTVGVIIDPEGNGIEIKAAGPVSYSGRGMTGGELAKQIYEAAHLTGTFLLRSGQASNEYFDKYLFEANPLLLSRVAEELAGMVPKGVEVLAGLEMGGIPIATALSLRTSIPAAFVRKKAKDYGTCKLAEGTNTEGKRTCIIEDVITTGGQVVLSVDDLRTRGAIVTDVLCVIERNSEGRKKLEDIGLRVYSLFTMEELAAAAGA